MLKNQLVAGTKTAQVYGSEDIIERHRHRYEMNNRYIQCLRKRHENFRLFTNSTLSEWKLLKFLHIHGCCCTIPPEFTSSPRDGHPLFANFIDAAKVAPKQ